MGPPFPATRTHWSQAFFTVPSPTCRAPPPQNQGRKPRSEATPAVRAGPRRGSPGRSRVSRGPRRGSKAIFPRRYQPTPRGRSATRLLGNVVRARSSPGCLASAGQTRRGTRVRDGAPGAAAAGARWEGVRDGARGQQQSADGSGADLTRGPSPREQRGSGRRRRPRGRPGSRGPTALRDLGG